MQKLAISTLAAVMLAGSFSVVADASATDVAKLRDQLVELGVPTTGADQLVNYLQTVKLTAADKAEIEALVKEAKSIIGNQKDLTKLSSDAKQNLVNLAKKAGAKVGLTVNYDVVDGVKTIALVSSKGESILSLKSTDLEKALTNFNGDVIALVDSIVSTGAAVVTTPSSNNGTSTTPVPGAGLNNTGAELPTMVMAGTGLVVLAAGLMVVSKRELQK